MTTSIIILHIVFVMMMIGIILIQKSESGALGIGGGNSATNFMTTRGTANLLTRTTAVLAVIFFILTLVLAFIFKGAHRTQSILNEESQSSMTRAPIASDKDELSSASAKPEDK